MKIISNEMLYKYIFECGKRTPLKSQKHSYKNIIKNSGINGLNVRCSLVHFQWHFHSDKLNEK